MKRFVIVVLVIVVAAVAGLVVARPAIGRALERKANAELAARGVPATVTGVTVGVRGVHATEICLRGDADEGAAPLGCLRDVALVVPIDLVLVGRARVDAVSVGSGELDLSPTDAVADLREIALRLATEARERPVVRADETDETDEPRETMALASVRIERFEFTPPAGTPVTSLQVRDLVMARTGETTRLDASLEFEYAGDAATGGIAGLPAVLAIHAEVSSRWFVEVRAADGQPFGASFQAPSGRVHAQVASARLDSQRVISVQDLGVRTDDDRATFAAKALELELRDFVTDVADLYMARASFQEPHLHLAVGDGTFVDTIGGLFEGAPADGSGEAVEAEGSGAAASPAVPDVDPWAGRRWWERIPQRIDVRNGTVSADFRFLTDPPFPADVRLERIDASYALRAIRTQLDLASQADLVMSDRPAGHVALGATWDWVDSTLELDISAADVEVGALNALTAGTRAAMARGQVTLDVKFRELPDGSIPEFAGSVSVEPLEATVGLLRNRLWVEHLDWSWAATREPGQTALVFLEGDGHLGGATFSFRPVIHGFDYENPLLGDRIDVRFSVPEQDATTLLTAVPPGLAGPIGGAGMTGTWGMDLEFPLTWGPVDPASGRPTLDVGEPTAFAVHDEDLHLEFLPPEIDVRRLNDAMEFTFTGQDAAAPGRVIAIPAPAGGTTGDAAGVGIDLDAAAAPVPGWTRLEDISYFLVAATLYREDGRFFRNRGINWFQWRSVIEQAWAEQQLGRGASTISMQLVKNVFLSHERTLERKLHELFLTYWMTRLVPKDRILEVYLNVIEWGPGVNGITEASAYYFGKSPADLTVAEAVWLSSIIPAPVRRGQQRNRGVASDWSIRHCHDLMRGMADRGWITRGELAKGLSGTVRFVTATGPEPTRPVPGVDALGNLLEDATELAAEGAPPVSPEGVRLDQPPRQRLRDLVATQLQLRP